MLYIQVQLQHLQIQMLNLIERNDFSVTIEKFTTLQEKEGPPEDVMSFLMKIKMKQIC